MTMIESLRDEFGHETATTRRHLERVPDDRLDWRPHTKSYTARGLASHLVECVGWTTRIFGADEFDIDPAAYKAFSAASVADLLRTYDTAVADGQRLLAAASEEDVARPWRLKIRGRQRFERTRAAAFRDFTLSHVIHHRGQLSVYLRLLEVAVPGSYGPTADEPF
jgi:uncharacterized damage-inducible protein DinB